MGEPLTVETMTRALDDLLDSTQAVTRALLGVTGPGGRSAGGHGSVGWMAPVPGLAPGPDGGGAYQSNIIITRGD